MLWLCRLFWCLQVGKDSQNTSTVLFTFVAHKGITKLSSSCSYSILKSLICTLQYAIVTEYNQNLEQTCICILQITSFPNLMHYLVLKCLNYFRMEKNFKISFYREYEDYVRLQKENEVVTHNFTEEKLKIDQVLEKEMKTYHEDTEKFNKQYADLLEAVSKHVPFPSLT